MSQQLTFVCVSCEFKGKNFLTSIHDLGHSVYLITSESTSSSPWPHDALEDIFYMPGEDGRQWDDDMLIKGVAYLLSQTPIDKFIALDDYDVHKVSMLREVFRSPGMGLTTGRHFFDKLAMRMQARAHDLLIPAFTALFNDKAIHAFFTEHNGPYVVKPRSDAGALGIRKLQNADDFWAWNEEHKEHRHEYLVECFEPGDVYHVDGLFTDFESHFTRSSRYLQPPFEIAHGGGIFRSQTLDIDDEQAKELQKLNDRLISAFGLKFGVCHSEFILSKADGRFYFLETSARVGGAHLSDMVHVASGVDLWTEWAKIEVAMLLDQSYQLPGQKDSNAGIVVSLSRYEHPDYGPLSHPALKWTLTEKDYHIGMIYEDRDPDQVRHLLDVYTARIHADYHASVPLKE